jgi:lipopolysaccharide/colanic/teichoic acid biosynthesis glycosyltransferase
MDLVRFEHSDEFDRQRLLVKPGLTGLAQVAGNTKRTWEQRMQMDVWYIANWSISLDLEILYMTLGVILFGEHVRESYFKRRITDRSFRIIEKPRRKII